MASTSSLIISFINVLLRYCNNLEILLSGCSGKSHKLSNSQDTAHNPET